MKIWMVFGLFALVIVGSFVAQATGDATSAAQEWAADMGYHDAHVHCQQWDNDGNGKVSCDVRTPDGAIVAIDCSYFPSSECTQRKMLELPETRRRR